MTALSDTAVVLLAAGLAIRHPGQHKLLRSFRGKPLGLHAATTISSLRAPTNIAVLSAPTQALGKDLAGLGFTTFRNDEPAAGLSTSIRIGVLAARERQARQILICLADMPFVSAPHLLSLLGQINRDDAPVCVGSRYPRGKTTMPPAAFRGAAIDQLLELEGDRGARSILRSAAFLTAKEPELADFDDPETFDIFERE